MKSHNSLIRRSSINTKRKLLLITGLALAAMGNAAFAADEIIDGGATVIISTQPTSDIPSPWIIDDDLFVGLAGAGTLTIMDGGLVTVAGTRHIGSSNGAGTVRVTGLGSQFTGWELNIGSTGAGTLIVDNGGMMTSSGSTNVGSEKSFGTLVLDTGGSVHTDLSFNIGFLSTGSATVTGAGSKLSAGEDMTVGFIGNGTLNVNKGAVVSSPLTYIAYLSSSTSTVTVDGGTLNSTLTVGNAGNGTLTIKGGGLVNSSGLSVIGSEAGGTGKVHVTGRGSQWIAGEEVDVGSFGNGTLIVDNSGVLSTQSMLVGSNAGGTGTLTIDNGGAVTSESTVIAAQESSTGTVTVDAGGSLKTDGALTIGGAGNGTLTINGGMVRSQSTTIAAGVGSIGTVTIGADGTFNTDSIEFGDGKGTLNFNTGSEYAFVSSMSGTGNLEVQSGHVTLTGDSGAFNGKTQVFDKSILSVNGVLGGTLDVLSGGVLGGIGTVGSTTIEDLAILAPGNSIGTIHVNGDLTFSPGSTYLVETSADGTSDKSEVSGTASLNGARVQVEADSGNWQPTTTYTILTSTGGVSGLFSGVTANLAFLKPVIGYPDANTVILSLEVPVDEKNPDRTIAQLQGKIYPSLAGVLLEDSRFINEAVNNRMRSAFGVSSTPVPVLAFGPEGAELQAATTDRFALWAQGFGSREDKKSDEAFAGLDRSIGGVFAGGDAAIGDHVRLGLVGGYGHTKLDEPDLAASASVDSYYLGVYGGAELGAVKLRSGASYTRHDIGIERQVQFTDTREYLGADYHAGTAQAFGEIGYNIRAASVDLEPFANLAYANLRSASFAETGGTAALSGGASTNDVTYSTLGLRASTELSLGFADATLRGTAAWRHAYGDITPVSSNAFAGAGTFDVSGLPIARDTAWLEAGFDMDVAKNTTIGLVYQGQIASKVQDHGFKANLNVRF